MQLKVFARVSLRKCKVLRDNLLFNSFNADKRCYQEYTIHFIVGET